VARKRAPHKTWSEVSNILSNLTGFDWKSSVAPPQLCSGISLIFESVAPVIGFSELAQYDGNPQEIDRLEVSHKKSSFLVVYNLRYSICNSDWKSLFSNGSQRTAAQESEISLFAEMNWRGNFSVISRIVWIHWKIHIVALKWQYIPSIWIKSQSFNFVSHWQTFPQSR
jgi:hypothetical protein